MSAQADNLRDYFIGWQCRLRQQAVRKNDGRPSEGMRAGLYVKVSDRNLGPINTGLALADSEEITSEFQHICKKTHDPNLRHQAAIKLLGSAYYQHPKTFTDSLLATFAVDSELADLLEEQGECRLEFNQYQQSFQLHCNVGALTDTDPMYQTVYWHNKMFNPVLPASVRILQFKPEWAVSTAQPPVTRA
jgi:hypothetical protein